MKHIAILLFLWTFSAEAGGRRVRHLNPAHAGAVLVLDSRFITGLADGDPVSTWNDRSSNGLNATSSGTARPLYKVAIQGGCPALNFDAVNDELVGTFNYTQTAATVICTAQVPGFSPYARFFQLSDAGADFSTSGHYIPLLRANGTSQIASWVGGNLRGTIAVNTGWTTLSAQHSGSSLLVRAAGVSGSSFSNTLSKTWTRYGISSNTMAAGGAVLGANYGSAAVFNTALSLPLLKRIEHAQSFSFKVPCN
jgi:hypothetical protein